MWIGLVWAQVLDLPRVLDQRLQRILAQVLAPYQNCPRQGLHISNQVCDWPGLLDLPKARLA
jgi:hypothetical protein